MSRGALRAVLGAAVLASASGSALAAGFGIEDRSTSQLGMSNAGAAAAAEDASTIADNPAGIARLSGPELSAAGTFIDPHLPFRNAGSTFPGGRPINGRNDDAGGFAPVPSFFYAQPLGEGFSAGVGMFTSFGLATNYQAGWVGRYIAKSTELTTLDFAPALAYQLTPGIAVGISPVLRYSKAKLASAIDFGAIGAAAGIPGAAPGSADGSIKIKGHAWSAAFNGGVLLQPTDTTRLGIAYFWNDSPGIDGSARFGRPPLGDIIARATGSFVDTDAKVVLGYPDRLTLGIVQTITPEFDLRLGASWVQWHSFKEERITFRNPQQPDSVTSEHWHDTVNVSIGGSYRLTPDLVLRAGIGYDQTPLSDPQHRNPRLPDASRITPSVGFGYRITPSTSVDVAYQRLIGAGNVKSDETVPTGDRTVGYTSLSADIFGVQLNVRF